MSITFNLGEVWTNFQSKFKIVQPYLIFEEWENAQNHFVHLCSEHIK